MILPAGVRLLQLVDEDIATVRLSLETHPSGSILFVLEGVDGDGKEFKSRTFALAEKDRAQLAAFLNERTPVKR